MKSGFQASQLRIERHFWRNQSSVFTAPVILIRHYDLLKAAHRHNQRAYSSEVNFL